MNRSLVQTLIKPTKGWDQSHLIYFKQHLIKITAKRDWMKEGEGISQRTCMHDHKHRQQYGDGLREGETRAGCGNG